MARVRASVEPFLFEQIILWNVQSQHLCSLFQLPPACDRPIFMNAINHANFYVASNRHKETFFSFRSFHSFLLCSTFCLFSIYSNTIHCAGESLSALPFYCCGGPTATHFAATTWLRVFWHGWMSRMTISHPEHEAREMEKSRTTKTRELATRIWFPFSIKMDFLVNAVFIAVTRFDTYLNTSITNYEWRFISRLIPRSTFNICVPRHGNDFGSTTATAAGILVSR